MTRAVENAGASNNEGLAHGAGEARRPERLDAVDRASAESMDASDPPAFGGATGIGPPPLEPAPSDDEDDQAIRECAYGLWEEAGRPHERDPADFWHQARRVLGRELGSG